LLLSAVLLSLAACGNGHTLGLTSPQLQELLRLINQTRASSEVKCRGVKQNPAPPLQSEGHLIWSAQMHAEDMAKAGILSHDTPPGAVHFRAGTSPEERIVSSGYLPRAWGENIARGQTTPQQVLHDWLASTEGHCEALMRPDYVHAGLGKSGDYWVLDMAAPQ